MPYEPKPLALAPSRLNAIEKRLAELNWASAPLFAINGLKREELIASGSMILHEVYFDSLGSTGGDPGGTLKAAIERDFGFADAWCADTPLKKVARLLGLK